MGELSFGWPKVMQRFIVEALYVVSKRDSLCG